MVEIWGVKGHPSTLCTSVAPIWSSRYFHRALLFGIDLRCWKLGTSLEYVIVGWLYPSNNCNPHFRNSQFEIFDWWLIDGCLFCLNIFYVQTHEQLELISSLSKDPHVLQRGLAGGPQSNEKNMNFKTYFLFSFVLDY